MTVEEATQCVSLIQRAFPAMRMEQRFYIRGCLKFEAVPAKAAILGAIEDEWKFAPSVFEMMEVLRRTVEREDRNVCHHGVSFFARCERCLEEAG